MTSQELLFTIFVLARNVLYLVIAVAVMFSAFELLFKRMNISLGITFKEHAWDEIKKEPMAVALYFGLRMLGVLVACGTVAAAFIK